MAAEFLQNLLELVSQGKVLISEHGYEELAADEITVSEIVQGIGGGRLVAYYPEYHKRPCVLTTR